MNIQISTSILSADFTHLESEINNITNAGTDYIHIDVMDGHFVPNITMGYFFANQIKKYTNTKLDVHLMTTCTETIIDQFISLRPEIITVHLEAVTHICRMLTKIQSNNIKAGIAINPSTPAILLEEIMHYADLILIMTVNPGFAGQKFLPNQIKKIAQIKKMTANNNKNIRISVDGGVNKENSKTLINAGADILVAGTSIFQNKNYKNNITRLKQYE